MKIKLLVAFIAITFITAKLMAQELTWAGKRIGNTSMFLDPNEVQMFGSITLIEYDDNTEIKDFGNLSNELYEESNSVQYIPFSFGGAQSIVSRQLTDQKANSWEVIGEVGVTTQFEWRHMDSGGIQRNNLNSDFRIAFSYIRNYESSRYRIRFFHVSSHLGDDFIIRHGINKFFPTKMNYEQLDISYFKDFGTDHLWYAGIGSVIRPDSPRAPFSYMAGTQLNWIKAMNHWGWTAGINVKGHQETDFNPNTKIAVGPAYFTDSKKEPIRLVLEYYMGHLPYSQFETQKVSWFGAGVYFYI